MFKIDTDKISLNTIAAAVAVIGVIYLVYRAKNAVSDAVDVVVDTVKDQFTIVKPTVTGDRAALAKIGINIDNFVLYQPTNGWSGLNLIKGSYKINHKDKAGKIIFTNYYRPKNSTPQTVYSL